VQVINPANQLGIGDRVGSIEKGKDGDIVIFNAHPLSVYAIPQMTIVDGMVRFDINNDAQDMRIDIDPEEKFDDTFINLNAEDEERCMQDVYSELFLGESSHSHAGHRH